MQHEVAEMCSKLYYYALTGWSYDSDGDRIDVEARQLVRLYPDGSAIGSFSYIPDIDRPDTHSICGSYRLSENGRFRLDFARIIGNFTIGYSSVQ